MTRKYLYRRTLILRLNLPIGALLLFLIACAPFQQIKTEKILFAEDVDAYKNIPKNIALFADETNTTVELSVEPTDKQVFFVFTNLADTKADLPFLTARTVSRSRAAASPSPTPKNKLSAPRGEIHPQLFTLEYPLEKGARSRAAASPKALRANTLALNTDKTFYIDSRYSPGSVSQLEFRLVAQATDSTWTLNLWLDKTDKFLDTDNDRASIKTFGERFIKTGGNNDIFDWITNIYGLPWGQYSGYSNLIGEEERTINILLTDIQGDGSENSGTFIAGYFSTKHNIDNADGSNKQLQFVIDSKHTKDDVNETLGTLAHEFQHMIHFYQVQILKNAESPIWINELMSEAASEFIADKIPITGARGVGLRANNYNYDAAGSKIRGGGRMIAANANFALAYSHNIWRSGNSVLFSYAANYSLGSYLAKNFGGDEFYRNLISKMGTNGMQSISRALSLSGYADESYASIIRKWPVSAILSAATAPAGLEANRISEPHKFSSSSNGIDYDLGSTDYFGYYDFTTKSVPISSSYEEQEDGQLKRSYRDPYLDSNQNTVIDQLESGASFIYLAAKGLQATSTWSIKLPYGIKYTLVQTD